MVIHRQDSNGRNQSLSFHKRCELDTFFEGKKFHHQMGPLLSCVIRITGHINIILYVPKPNIELYRKKPCLFRIKQTARKYN